MLDKIKQIEGFILPIKDNNYRPHILDGRFLSYLAFILFLLKFVVFFHLLIIPQSSYFANIVTGLLVKMTNEERQIVGAPTLTVNSELSRAAELKARDMVQNNYFAHTSPQGKSPWYWFDLVGYNYEYAGENLAVGYLDAKEVHRAWIGSSTHRENIVNSRYREVGIAVVESNDMGRSTFYVVQMFGTPRKIKTSVALTEKLIAPLDKKNIEIIPEETKKEVEREPEKEPEKELEGDFFVEERQNETTQEFQETEEEQDEEKEERESFVLGEFDKGVYIYTAGIVDSETFGFFEFFLLEYDEIVQQITMAVLLFLCFVLIINVFLRFDVQHPDLIFKGFCFLVLFIIFDYLDQSTIIRIIFDSPIVK
jgi:hypothetical protein